MSTAAVLSPSPVQKFFDNNGNPLAGGTVTTYVAGTSIPIATYTDYTASTTNTNPIVLNYRGEASIWITPNVAYKYVVNDSLGNAISTTDQITVNQLLTLFAGVDTGIASAYVVNFVASFSAYANGIVLYFIPANNNTGPSTLNVNGLGVLPILNVTGATLGANQIVAGQMVEVVYYNGNWQLITISNFSGSTIGTFGAESTIVSAGTTDLGSAAAHVVNVTGTTTITSLGTSATTAAPIYSVRFSGSLTLTAGANILLPGNTNIVTQAGDAGLFEYMGAGVWRLLVYNPFSYKTPQSGSFTATLTGMSASTTGTMQYSVSNGQATLWLLSAITGTSNAASLTVTGLPALIVPSGLRTVVTTIENSTTAQVPAIATISGSGVITFLVFNSSVYNGLPSASGTKGLTSDWQITYPL